MNKSRKNKDISKTVKHVAFTLGALALLVLLVSAATAVRNNNSTIIKINIDKLGEQKSLLIEKDILGIIERTYGFDLVGVPISEIDVLDAQNEVHVHVVPRKAIIRVVDEFGSNYFLDKDGIRLPISTNFTPRVMVAHGKVPQYHDQAFSEKKGVLYDIYSLGLKINSDPFLAAQIDQIFINKKNEVELIPKIGKQEILFGSFKEVDEKLENLIAFYKNGIGYKGWKTYEKIDLRYNKQVVCR